MLLSVSTTRRAQRGMVREWRLHVLSIFSLAVAFVCLGAALLVVTNLHAVEQRWAHAGRASVYLKDGATQEEVDSLRLALARVPGVIAVRYVSSGDARAEFGRTQLPNETPNETGQRPAATAPLAALPIEAFPASIEIDVAPDMPDGELADMVAKMKTLPTVDDVETYQSWTERLARLVRGGVAASALLAVVVLAAVLAVVGSTMRMALQRRRTEVEVLKLVGATDGFVKKPFVIEGSLQGALGALGAIVLLAVLFLLVRGRLDGELATLVGVAPSFLPWQVAAGMVVLGAVLGAAAALASLRKLVAV
jgi:cell division transport system permease protein